MDYYKLKVLNNKRKIIIGLSIVLSIIGCLVYYFEFYNEDNEEVIKNDNFLEIEKEEDNNTLQTITVDIKGFVEKPGVYSFKVGDNARINDLILKAGGLKKEADTSILNLSKKLEDEMTIVIYSQKEVNDFVNTKNEFAKKLELCELKLKNNACIKDEQVIDEKNTKLVNINKASIEELMSLPGIGETKAKAIINYRSKKSFNSISDIKNVDGIGESLFESIKEYLTI